jgi:putative membrane protein
VNKSQSLRLPLCLFVITLVGGLVPVVLSAQNDNGVSPADRKFVTAALKGGMAEVQMGQLAVQKGNSQDVKDFGQKMVDDHGKMGEQMKDIAGKIGISVPSNPSPLAEIDIKRLQKMSGDQFDQAYIKIMLKGHEADLKDFKSEANYGRSLDVKTAASQGADMVQMHLDMIKHIAQAHNIPVE